MNPLAAALLIERFCDKAIKRRQVDVGEPRRGIVPDCKIVGIFKKGFLFGRRIDDLIQDTQKSGIFDLTVQQIAQFCKIDRLIKVPDIELHKMSTVTGANPLLHRFPSVLNAALWEIPAGIPIHALYHHVFNGQHCHPLDKMISQARNLNFPLFAAGCDVALFPGFMLPLTGL